MSGRMRKRKKAAIKGSGYRTKPKGFHYPQKDNSVRQRRRAKLNNYNDQKKEK